VNRDRLIESAFGGYAYPLAGLAAPYQAGVPGEQRPYAYDPESARELLVTAGWPAGRELRIATLSDMEVARNLAEDYQKSLGVEISLKVIPPESTLAAQHRFPSLRSSWSSSPHLRP
jgi:ABC-type transport system substrate-binding protein